MIANITAMTSSLLDWTSGIFTQHRAEIESVVKKTGYVAFEVFKLSMAFWLNPYFTLSAVAAGLLFPHEANEKLDRIWRVVNEHKYYAFPVLFFCTLLHLPAPLLGYSMYIGGRLGSSIIHFDPAENNRKQTLSSITIHIDGAKLSPNQNLSISLSEKSSS